MFLRLLFDWLNALNRLRQKERRIMLWTDIMSSSFWICLDLSNSKSQFMGCPFTCSFYVFKMYVSLFLFMKIKLEQLKKIILRKLVALLGSSNQNNITTTDIMLQPPRLKNINYLSQKDQSSGLKLCLFFLNSNLDVIFTHLYLLYFLFE